MANYRITVEPISEEAKKADIRLEGQEVDGFTLITETDEDTCVSIGSVSILDIARAMAGDIDLAQAAMIANGLSKAKALKAEMTKNRFIQMISETAKAKKEDD